MSENKTLIKISNEESSKLPPLVFSGEIIVVDKPEQIEAACRDIARYPIIGFDTETRPSFKAGVSYKVALLQLSTPLKCYLFRLNKIPLDRAILSILERKDIIKLGADVLGDLRSLRQLRNFKENGFVDLQKIIEQYGIGEKSLRKMSALVLGYRISKAQRLSNWEAVTFTPQQQQYAATDAWACIEIYNKLQKMQKIQKGNI
ncbi:MAG: 3'-5' exonuclease [Rikenellaceae bacterium]